SPPRSGKLRYVLKPTGAAMPTTTRRNLLRTSALAAASALVVPHVHAAEPHDSEVIRFGIVGCGGRGSGAVIQALKANKKNHLTAIGDLFPDVLQGDKGAIARYKANGEVADQIKLTPDTIFTGFDAYKKV